MTTALRCLGGQPAPEPMVRGGARYAELPESVQREIWDPVLAFLLEPNAPGMQERIESFRGERGIPVERFGPAFQACAFLLSQAASHDAGAEDVRVDLESLCGGPTAGSSLIVERFDAIKARLRDSSLLHTLADHGRVLTGLSWRVDQVTASSRGAQSGASVVYLTLQYREGDDLGRMTLQLTPKGLQDLKGFLDRFES